MTSSFPMVMVSGAMQGGCVCENAPLLRIGTNNIELAALFAPKPLGMSAANDWTRDLLTARPAGDQVDLQVVRRRRSRHGDVPCRSSTAIIFSSRELMYSWFSTHLKPAGPP